jgi:hypothetical protein
MHHRTPSSRHGDEVAVDPGDGLGNGGAVRVECHHVDARDAPRAADVDDDGVGDDFDAGLAHALGEIAVRRATGVDDGSHFDARRHEPERAVRYALSLLVNTTARVPAARRSGS